MGTYKNKTYNLRIDNELMGKVRQIAQTEDRPLSKQLERIIREYVNNYEKMNGAINIKITSNDNSVLNVQNNINKD
jgi:hypothetical protein